MIIKNAKIPCGEGWRTVDFQIRDGRFAEISDIIAAGDTPAAIIDVCGKRVFPGFIDTHIHGVYGVSFDDPLCDLARASAFLAREGVTAFVPTVTASSGEVPPSLANIAAAKTITGAKICGIHMEGPFLSPQFHGAFDTKTLRLPDPDFLRSCAVASVGLLKIMTFAPELEGSAELLKAARELGVSLSIGHTAADFETAQAAINGGARRVTHLFNAMAPLHHRTASALTAALTNDDVTCEIICDFFHLHPETVRLALKVKTAARLCAISDAMSCAGLEAGEYEFGGRAIIVDGGIARLADGTICGSCMTLRNGAKNLLEIGVTPAEVSEMCSLNPASALRIDKETGSLEVGKLADFAVFDEDFEVCQTVIGGEITFSREDPQC